MDGRYLGPWHTSSFWLSVFECERDLITIFCGLLVGNIDDTIKADSIRPDECCRDSETDCFWHACLIDILSNIRCHNVSVMIFTTRSRNKFKSPLAVAMVVAAAAAAAVVCVPSTWQRCWSTSNVFSREQLIRFPIIL